MEAPRIPSLFKGKKPRQFTYRPWFYNQEKEERERRNVLLRAGRDPGMSAGGFRGKLSRQRGGGGGMKSQLRILLILALLLLALFLFFN